MDDFRVPQDIPQDLLLIHDIIGVTKAAPGPTPQKSVIAPIEDSIDSSDDDDNASEDEIEADLIVTQDDEPFKTILESSSDSGSDSDSDSGSDSSTGGDNRRISTDLGLDDDEESGPPPTTGTYFQTKNEVVQTDINIPDITEVGQEEVLEKVGEIMAVMDKVVIIRGVPSGMANQGSERALDSDTLIVFDDRKVMGYIYETFGPTSQPLYQVKFNSPFTFSPEQLQVSREVFHVPARSHFVFLNHLKRLKGSDASNVHDEEPADNELEFSDDEAEAAFKSRLKRKRGDSRANSIALSRQSTPTPSQMRDQDMDVTILSRNAYDEHGPYDLDFSAGPSRPLPIPYDDPYADEYTPLSPHITNKNTQAGSSTRGGDRNSSTTERDGRGYERSEARGRGRGRGRGRKEHNNRRAGSHETWQRQVSTTNNMGWHPPSMSAAQDASASFNPYAPRPLSPTSLAIARATGQMIDSSAYAPPPHIPNEAWGYQNPALQQALPFQFGAQNYVPPFVQPHINPRFAPAFAINMSIGQSPRSAPYESRMSNIDNSTPQNGPSWTDEWTVPTGAASPAVNPKK